MATAGAFHAYSLEQRRALSAAAGWLECAHGTVHGQGAGRAGAIEADGGGCPDALDRYVRVACVSLCRSVSSHENARVPHTAVPWQVRPSTNAPGPPVDWPIRGGSSRIKPDQAGSKLDQLVDPVAIPARKFDFTFNAGRGCLQPPWPSSPLPCSVRNKHQILNLVRSYVPYLHRTPAEYSDFVC